MKCLMSVFVGLLVALFAFNQAEAALVGYWPMDEDSGSIVNDASGNGLNGTISGAEWTDGMFGSALDFDGIDDYVGITPTIDLSSNRITEEAWVILYGIGNSDGTPHNIITIEDGWDRYQFGIDVVLGTFRLYAQIDTKSGLNNSYVVAQTTTALSLNTWYHVACTYDGSVLKLYINGTLAASVPNLNPSYVLRYDFTTMEIGAAFFGGGPQRLIDGAIDEVAIYNEALSASEISQHFADTIPPVVVITHPVNGDTLNSAVVTVAGDASDSGSGLASVEASINKVALDFGDGTFGGQVLHTLKDFTITVTATDNAGNTNSDTVTVSMQHDQGLHRGQQ